MNKEVVKKMTASNRFWGLVLLGVGGVLTAFPVTTIAGTTFMTIGGSMLGVGLVSKRKRDLEKSKSDDDSESL